MTASVVVPLLVQYAEHLAGVAGNAVADATLAKRLRALWRAVKTRFESEHGATDALRQLEEQPEGTEWRRAVETHLAELLRSDREFARLVARLTDDARRVDISDVSVRDGGAVAFGGDVSISGTYAAGRDLTIPGIEPGSDRREE